VDAHDETADPEANWQCVNLIVDTLGTFELAPLVCESNGKGGYHIRTFFKKPVPSAAAYWLGEVIHARLAAAGLPKVEVFPKRGEVTLATPYGNWMRLPGKHPKRDHWTRIWDRETERWLEGKAAARALIQIAGDATEQLLKAFHAQQPQHGSKPARPPHGRPAGHEADRVRAALEYYRNDNLPYDTWLAVGMSLNDWDSTCGLEIWREWSRQSSKHVDGECERKWPSFVPGGGLTIASIFKAAADNGWNRAASAGPASRRPATATPSANGDGGRGAPGLEPSTRLPREFRLDTIDSTSLCAEMDPPRWLIKGVLVADNPAIVGGPMKTLKTSILIDMTVSLGTGCKFLGWFEVQKPIRVGFISGESGRYVIRQNAREIGWTRGVELMEDKNIVWGFTLPTLSDHAHLVVAEKMIKDNGLECLILDPFYLTVPPDAVDHKNMFSLGPVLDAFGNMCVKAGCLPVLVHHFVKSRENPYAPPELHELAYGGASQWMRQWCLVTRRERYDANTGLHKLHWRHGGSFGHSGELSLDIDTGVIDEDFRGRKWKVTVTTTTERIENQEQERQAQTLERETKKTAEKKAAEERKDREDMGTALTFFQKQPDHRLTKTGLREAANWNALRAGHILYRLEADKFIKPCRVAVTIGKGGTRMCDGYELNDCTTSVLTRTSGFFPSTDDRPDVPGDHPYGEGCTHR
jgi:replicative DNA helicase